MAHAGKTVNKCGLKPACISVLMAGALSLAGIAQSPADSSLLAAIGAGHYDEAVKLADASLQTSPRNCLLYTSRCV